MSETLNTWICKPCERHNLLTDAKCRYCGAAIPDAVTIHEIALNSPAALELLGKARKNAKNGAGKAKAKAESKPPKVSSLEWQFEALWKLTGHPMPTPEFRFHPTRRWRFDYCFVNEKIAIELEGGTWQNGRHNRGKGYEADCQKYNQATILGFRILRFTKVNAETIETVETLFRQSSAQEKVA